MHTNNTTQHNTTINQLNSIYWKRFCLNKFILYTSSFFVFLFFFFFFWFVLFSFYNPIFPWFAFGYSFTLPHTNTQIHARAYVCMFLLLLVVCYSGANVLCVHNIRAFISYIHTEKTWNIKQVLKRETGMVKLKGKRREEKRKGKK